MMYVGYICFQNPLYADMNDLIFRVRILNFIHVHMKEVLTQAYRRKC